MEEDLIVNLPNPKKCLCYKCKKGVWNPGGSTCMAFKLKPSDVLYRNKDCEKFEEKK